jgi:uncharacterized protein YerC
MTQISKHPIEPKVEKRIYEIFIDSIKNSKNTNDIVDFLNDLLTPTEKVVLAKRLAVAYVLMKGDLDYRQISKTLRVSLGTIAKIHATFALQGNGYKKIISKMLLKQSIKKSFSELGDAFTSIPPKGANIGRWKKDRRLARREKEEIL